MPWAGTRPRDPENEKLQLYTKQNKLGRPRKRKPPTLYKILNEKLHKLNNLGNSKVPENENLQNEQILLEYTK